MDNIINKLNELKIELNEFENSRELSILKTKCEDLIIYFNAYSDKLIKK